MANDDPLRKLKAHLRNASADREFMSGEHAWLGNQGVEVACAALDESSRPYDAIARHDDDEEFSYGELVALSGDFYATPKDLFEESAGWWSWLYESNDISDLLAIFARELDAIEMQRRGDSVQYPVETIALAWNAKSYIELALDNTDHFGWHNAVEYVKRHEEALSLAAESKGQPDTSEAWRRALFTNAFADHFLTDGFAAGHVRVPRAQICIWGEGRGYDPKLSGALSKLLHDQDGHVSSFHSDGEPVDPEEGLLVTNAAGNTWRTRCDGQLFIGSKHDGTMVEQPTLAVAASFGELLRVRRGEQIDGPFAALEFMPFPHPDEKPLIEKFPADATDDVLGRFHASMQWYTKLPWLGAGAERDHVRALFQELPSLMEQFRSSVATAASTDHGLVLRLHPRYVEGFREVR